MKGQPHLLESPDPLPAGRDYDGLCGSPIKDAYFAGIWDGAYLGAVVLNAANLCPKCVSAYVFMAEARKEAGESVTRRFLYGMLNGSEVKRNEEE